MMPGVFDRYRQHQGSCCAIVGRAGEFSPDGGHSPARQRFLEWTAGYLAVQGSGAARFRWLVRLERWLGPQRAFIARVRRECRRVRGLASPRGIRATARAVASTIHGGNRA
jgi:hypothetical protein